MPGGRPTKFNSERARVICERLAEGWTRKAAAEASGVDYATFARWLAGDTESICEAELCEFREQITRAEAEAEGRMTRAISQAASDGDWRAAESWLKRRRYQEWGDRQDIGLVLDDLRALPDEELEALARKRGLT